MKHHEKYSDGSLFTQGALTPNKMQEDRRKVMELAGEVLKLSRNSLLINLRFLDAALIQFVPSESAQLTQDLATDGRMLYYNGWHVLRSYKKAKEIPTRDYLHVVLHCIFRHLFIGAKINRAAWDLACDIAVENIINGFNLSIVKCSREERQSDVIEMLRSEVGKLTAERLYRYFRDQELPEDDYSHLRDAFYCDDHSIWYQEAQRDGENNSKSGNEDQDIGDDVESPAKGDFADSEESTIPPEDGEDENSDVKGESSEEETDNGTGESGSDNESKPQGEEPRPDREEIEQLWKDISERIEVDIDTSSNKWGESNGDMIQELKSVNIERYNYAEFLRRFAVLGENIEVNDDEFDYIFYTYGMKLFENMPLVEPLEYKEVKRVREFVIALDTSQSVAGETVQKFVTKTYNILKQSENFFTKFNVHIIQCGASVQEDAKITCQEEFDRYIKTMTLCGFGGTDFRPVFTYVDELIAQHELTNLKGIIYFTDGFGTYPAQCPKYDAAFVFLENNDIPDVPVWAIKLLLTTEEIEMV